MKNNLIIILLLTIIMTITASCIPGEQPNVNQKDCGFLTHPKLDFSILLMTSDNRMHEYKSINKTAMIPAGKYTATRINLIKKDNKGKSWALMSQSLNMVFVIKKGETIEAKFGEPLIVKINSKNKTLYYDLKGNVDESYYLFSVNGKQLPAPSILIVDKRGNILEKGSFKYG